MCEFIQQSSGQVTKLEFLKHVGAQLVLVKSNSKIESIDSLSSFSTLSVLFSVGSKSVCSTVDYKIMCNIKVISITLTFSKVKRIRSAVAKILSFT